MIKRILIASLLLFMPIFANAETLVIGSSESLKEINLPLDTEILDSVIDALPVSWSSYTCYYDNGEETCIEETRDPVLVQNASRNHLKSGLYDLLLTGDSQRVALIRKLDVSIPFSANDLIRLCNMLMHSIDQDVCQPLALNYIKAISQKSNNAPDVNGIRICGEANKFKVQDNNSNLLSFEECTPSLWVNGDYYVWQACNSWYQKAENCGDYLVAKYTDKVNNGKLKSKERSMYECAINKIHMGQLSFPFDEDMFLKSCR